MPQLRPYQEEIVSETTNRFLGQHVGPRGPHPADASVMIESPTGSGKTVMGLYTALRLQQQLPDLVIGWVAMRRNLLSQAAREVVKFDLPLRDIHFVSMFDKDPVELIQARHEGRRILVVADEAQHDAASSMSHMHNMVAPNYILGLTATPYRTDKMKLCFSAVIKRAGIHQLIQDGYLSRYHHYSIPEWTVPTVADHYLREPERWGKSIFYFHRMSDCQHLSHILSARGVRHEIVTANSDREQQIEDFASGKTPVLVNCFVLCEGFDCPSLQTAWVRDSCKGPTVQMAGRVFRRHPDVPIKQVVQSKQTHWPMLRTAMADQQYVWTNGRWLSLTINPQLDAICKQSLLAISSLEIKLPKFILDKQRRRHNRFRRQ